VGGIKEKMLGAHRAGITTVILPTPNQVDLEDVPVEVRTHMIFAPVERVEQAILLALEEQPVPLEEFEEVIEDPEAAEDSGGDQAGADATPPAEGAGDAETPDGAESPEPERAPERPDIAAEPSSGVQWQPLPAHMRPE
jgi:ATP-dependent Lon protease